MDGGLRAMRSRAAVSAGSSCDGGFWKAPVFVDGWVFVGDRAGVFHAYDGRRRAEAWRTVTGGPILTPASLTIDGSRIVFGSEDMYVYCCKSNNGTVVWKSKKLPTSLRDYAPTIVSGVVLH